jgi:hypothetical protein
MLMTIQFWWWFEKFRQFLSWQIQLNPPNFAMPIDMDPANSWGFEVWFPAIKGG